MRAFEAYATRDEWFAARRCSIGASDVAAILGHSSYGSPLSVYHRLRVELGKARASSIPPPEDDEGTSGIDDAQTEAQEAGLAYEEANAHRYVRRTGREIQVLGGSSIIFRHPHVRGLHASPDAIQVDAHRGPSTLELKHWAYGMGRWEYEPPIAVTIQGLFQAECAGTTWYTCAAVIGGVRLIWHDIDKDEAIASAILERLVDFWAAVRDGREPSATGDDVPHLREWHRDTVASTSVDVESILLEDLEAAIRAKKTADSALDEIKASIMQRMGCAESALIGGIKVASWKTQTRSVFERTKVGEETCRVFRWDDKVGKQRKITW